MEILILATFVFLFVVSLGIAYLVVKLLRVSHQYEDTKALVLRAVEKINEARYGNFQIKLEDKKDTLHLYSSLNKLFESITDRDAVINEYREIEKENYSLKEEFIAALTHDLKVPIIAQDKTFDLLLKDKFGALADVQREVILRLKESNSDLKEMVNSILETYKAENAGVELNIVKNVNVEEFLTNCVDNLQNLAQSSGKKINLQICTKDFTADLDTFSIKRVLNNLVINALSHSETADSIDICLNKTGDTFSIDVVDYGRGIDEKEIEKIFNKYYSITGKSRVKSGLGLYLSNKIVKKHGGVIEVESKINEGSIFRIILPQKTLILN